MRNVPGILARNVPGILARPRRGCDGRPGRSIRRHLTTSVLAVIAGLAVQTAVSAPGDEAASAWRASVARQEALADTPPNASQEGRKAVGRADRDQAKQPARGPRSRRQGEIIRIERPRISRETLPLLCPIPDADKLTAACFGAAPEVGERALLFTYDGPSLGTLEVIQVGPGRMDHCNSNSTFEVGMEPVGELRDQGKHGNFPLLFAFFGVRADTDKSRLVQVPDTLSGLAGANTQVYMGLDQDGDTSPDLVVTAVACRSEAPPHPTGGSGEVLCIDYWASRSGTWVKLRRTYYYACT